MLKEDNVTGTLKHVKSSVREPVGSCCGGLAVMAQETNSLDPGSIPGRDTSFDVPEYSCLLSGPDSNWIPVTSGS